MSNNFKKGIIAFLVLLLIGLLFYSYNNNKEHIAIENKMQNEKDKLIDNLSKMELQYDDAISKNTMLSEELIVQKESIKNFKDSLKSIKKTNWKLINFYKNKIKDLNIISNKLVGLNDSLVRSNKTLSLDNQNLNTQKDSLTNNLNLQAIYNDTLVKQNLHLAKKVAVGKIVKASNFGVMTYKERSGGKYKETDRARKVTVFKTSFVLNENPIAENNNIKAHIIIYKPNGDLLVDKGVFSTTDGEKLHFSDISTIPYKKAAIASDILIKFGNIKLNKGTYTIDFYVNNKKAGSTQKNLR